MPIENKNDHFLAVKQKAYIGMPHWNNNAKWAANIDKLLFLLITKAYCSDTVWSNDATCKISVTFYENLSKNDVSFLGCTWIGELLMSPATTRGVAKF